MAITTLFLTGFEHGFIGSAAAAGGGLIDTYTGTGFTASTSSPRNGSYCAHCVAPLNTATRLTKTIAGNAVVTRFGLKVSSRPGSGTATVFNCVNALSVGATLFVSSAGVLSLVFGGGTAVTGPTIDTTSWHLIELQIGSSTTCDWKVDGVSQTQATGTGGGSYTSASLGTGATSPAYTADYDDWIVGTWTTAATDWYGDGKVLAQRPAADSPHTAVANFSFGDAGAALSGTVTTAYTMVDDPPGTGGWTATRSTTDNLALRIAVTNSMLRVNPAVTAETGTPNAVRAIVSYSSPATQANLAGCVFTNPDAVDTPLNGRVGTSQTGAGFNVTANNFKGAIIPPPAAGWTPANISSGWFMFGGCASVDISPVPTVQALMLEVDWPIIAPKSTPVRRLSMASRATPATRTLHTIKVRGRKQSGTGTVTIRAALYEGSTNRSGDLETTAVTTSLADYALAIPDASAANITDYSNLELRVWFYSLTGDAVTGELARVVLSAPATGGPQAYTRTAADTVTISDAALGDAALVPRTATDTVALSDAAVERTGVVKAAADSVTLSDVVTGAAGKGRSADDVNPMSDSANRAASTRVRTAADSVALSDVAVRIAAARVRTVADVMSVSDTAVRAAAAQVRAVADTVVLSDTAARAPSARLRTTADSVALSDTATQVAGQVRPAADSVALSDAATGVFTPGTVGLTRTAADAWAVSDAAVRAPGAQARTATDSWTQSDSAARAPATRVRTAADSFAMSDTAARTVAAQTRAATDAVTTSDAATRAAATRARTAGDSIATSDAAVRAPGARTGTATDTLSLSDAAARATVARVRTAVDAVTTSDAAVGVVVGGAIRAATDSWAVSDAAVRAAAAKVRVAADTVLVSDVATRAVSRALVAADALTVVDSATQIVARPRTAADSFVVSDSAAGIRVTTRAASDSLVVSDSAVRAPAARARGATDSIAVADLAVRAAATRIRTAADSTAVSDIATGIKVGGFPRTATDTVSVTDAAARVAGRQVAAVDTVATSDVVARAAAPRARVAADSVALVDTATRAAAHPGRTATDSTTVGDTATGVRILTRPAADAISVADSAARTTAPQRPVADSVAVSDAAQRGVIAYGRIATDLWFATDSATALIARARSAFDSWTISDFGVGVVSYEPVVEPVVIRLDGNRTRVEVDAVRYMVGFVDDRNSAVLDDPPGSTIAP